MKSTAREHLWHQSVREYLNQKNCQEVSQSKEHQDQGTNGPVNAHLISGPTKSTKHTKPGKKQGQEMTLIFNTHFHLLN